MPRIPTKATILHILNESLYWIAMGALVASMCGQVRKHSQPLVIPTPENIEAMEQLMQQERLETEE